MLVPVPTSCRIPELLRRRGQTQSWLADQVGLSRHRISDYVHMRKGLTMKTGYHIAHVLGVHAEELYTWEWREQE